MRTTYVRQARDPRRTYDAGNRWDSAEREPHTGYRHGEPLAPDEVEQRVMATAIEIVERATADGATDIGSVDDVAASIRDRITWERERIARNRHSYFRAGRTRGDADLALRRSPAPFERVRARTRSERSNRGTMIKRVTVHGRAYVMGDHVAERSPALAMTPDRLAHAIATAPATADGGRDAVALAMLADVAYPDIPRLIGGDVLSFHAMPVSDDVLARQARVGWPTRYRLPRIIARSGEPSTRRGPILLARADHAEPIRRDVPAMIRRDKRGRVIEVRTARTAVMSGDPDQQAWRGAKLHDRPMTVRDRRARQAKRADEHARVPAGEPLADRLAIGALLAPADRPYRITWEWREYDGALTIARSDSGRVRYSVSGLPEKVEGYSTVDGMARRVAAIMGDPIPATTGPRCNVAGYVADRIMATPAGNRYRRAVS